MNDRDNTPIVLLKKYWMQVGIFLFSFVVCGVSYWTNYSVHQEIKRHNQLYLTQSQTNKDASEALNILREYFPMYQSYVEKNIIGDANRLQQIETIKALGESIGLPSVSFSVEETVYATPSSYYLSDEFVHLQFSIMRLDFILNNEVQFQQFMDGLLMYSKGTFSMQQCTLIRSNDTVFDAATLELKGMCELHWYLLKDITGAWTDNEIANH